MSVTEPMSPLPGAYYSCCSPIYLFSDLSRIVWESLFLPQYEACNIIPHSIQSWACVVTLKWQGFKQSSFWLTLSLIFPFSCRSLLVSYPSVRCRYFMDYCSIVLIVPCSINCPQSDTIKCGILCMADFWGLSVKLVLTLKGFFTGSFPDFLQ